ncbi:uncharacterized protein PAC_00987 [Phialocephala subalpina]|uniref:BTB domain-containing protein n=1 Tax=Phialocephala subalpina TaxID=576137 RepID=A0A1L7WEA7_9HELO|nr:uncharacterized protein PAC_00987 [Phialocephala subalpina]
MSEVEELSDLESVASHVVELEPLKKKRKMSPVAFSDPTATVNLIVGRDHNEKTFLVRAEVANKSPVLKASFESNNYLDEDDECYDAERDHTYRFGDSTSEGALRFLVQWLYSQELTVFRLRDNDAEGEENPWAHDDERTEYLDQEELDLINLWVLAEELELPELQNLALTTIDGVIRLGEPGHCDVHLHVIDHIYNITDIWEHPLRLYIVAASAQHISLDRYDHGDIPSELSIEFLFELAQYQPRNPHKQVCNIADFLVNVD